MKSNLTTLCYLEKDEQYLMLHRIKKEQDINKDKWIGVGGHFEADESPEECLIREVFEETGLTLHSWKQRGIITFISNNWQTEYMFLYTSDDFSGELCECDEGALEWVSKKDISTLPLWTGDHIFLQLLQNDQPFFSLKLRYENDDLIEAVLDGTTILRN